MSFDDAASGYDATFGLSPAGRLFRFRLAERVGELASPPRRVLDVGCGTGEDALWLSGCGYAVTGIDASIKMIERAREKNGLAGERAEFVHSTLADFSARDETFDAAISDFGALNCLPTEEWVPHLARLVRPDGYVLVSLMGRNPAPEIMREGGVNPTRRGRSLPSVGDSVVRTSYPRFSEIRRALEPAFRISRIEALGCCVPGPQYDGFARRSPIAFGLLAILEACVRRLPVIRSLGDHTLIEAVRR
jgi:SAM-dependent methyltransferase